MVRLRLYETLTLLPANSLESSYTHLLRMLVAEFTLTDNPANTTNSLLRELCHSDDSIILGTWLQETDHKTIEDQVNTIPTHCESYSFVETNLVFISIGLDRDHVVLSIFDIHMYLLTISNQNKIKLIFVMSLCIHISFH